MKSALRFKKALAVLGRYWIPCEIDIEEQHLILIPYGKPVGRTVKIRSELSLTALEKLLIMKADTMKKKMPLEDIVSISLYYIRNPKKPIKDFLSSEKGVGLIELTTQGGEGIRVLLNYREALKLQSKLRSLTRTSK